MLLHPAGHRLIFSMSQKRMVRVQAGGKICGFLQTTPLQSKHAHLLLLLFLVCRCGILDQVKSTKISEDKKFRKTEKGVVKSKKKKFKWRDLFSYDVQEGFSLFSLIFRTSSDTAGSYHAGHGKQNMLVMFSTLAYLLLFVDFFLFCFGEHVTLLCLITEISRLCI